MSLQPIEIIEEILGAYAEDGSAMRRDEIHAYLTAFVSGPDGIADDADAVIDAVIGDAAIDAAQRERIKETVLQWAEELRRNLKDKQLPELPLYEDENGEPDYFSWCNAYLYALDNTPTDWFAESADEEFEDLFYPIMVLENKEALPFTMKPLSMNEESEIQFVKDLQKAAGEKGRLKEWTGDKDLYLLRNAANKAKGLGFALAGNFYPDFLLWLVDRESGRQWLTFIDPKGIRHMTWEHPKFGLADEVKKLEQSLKLQDLTLNSFILSVTPYKGLLEDGATAVFDKTEDEFREKHILFMEDENYLQTMFDMILNGDKA